MAVTGRNIPLPLALKPHYLNMHRKKKSEKKNPTKVALDGRLLTKEPRLRIPERNPAIPPRSLKLKRHNLSTACLDSSRGKQHQISKSWGGREAASFPRKNLQVNNGKTKPPFVLFSPSCVLLPFNAPAQEAAQMEPGLQGDSFLPETKQKNPKHRHCKKTHPPEFKKTSEAKY